ncbi:MAG: flagellar export chaperone FlgN [Spirochaetaceae bacterium]|nr:MAG: flagellar export chaperone FlgN [Spirochaetaceae bacterium]
MQTTTLKRSLRAEARSLKDFAELQKSLQKAISSRKWTELNKEIDALRLLADKIEALEADRIQAYQTLKSSLQAKDQDSFSEIVARLPPEERDELLELYRHLKAAVIRVKASAGLLNYYVQSMSEALRQILEELFPHRKGKMYSRSGKTKEPGDESLMLYGNA